MSQPTMFTIRVTHPVTGETLEFFGQGVTVVAALADGAKVINDPFRPSTSGHRHDPINLKVLTRDGRIVLKKLKAFENPPVEMDVPT